MHMNGPTWIIFLFGTGKVSGEEVAVSINRPPPFVPVREGMEFELNI